jgi:hypothetical protein
MIQIPFIGERRRRDLLGFLLVLLAGFLVIALATHNARDIDLVSDVVTWGDLFQLDTDNAAGLVGVWSSQALLWSVGKSSFLLVLLLILTGWRLLFHYDISWLRKKLLLVFTFTFSMGSLWFLLNIEQPDLRATITSADWQDRRFCSTGGGTGCNFFQRRPGATGNTLVGIEAGVAMVGRRCDRTLAQSQKHSRDPARIQVWQR